MNIPNPTLILGSSYALYLAYQAHNNNGIFGLYEGFINGPVYGGWLLR